MKYTPNPDDAVQDMLKSIGMNNLDELFSDIPADMMMKKKLNIPDGMCEMSLRKHMQDLAAKNITVDEYPCFLGAGAYDHYIPEALQQLLLRSEFYTAYTPYQPEISQGILQSIFEYQSMICSLTGMEVSNASLYDGGTALAEAANLAADSKKKKILVPESVHPEYIEILKTYAISGKTEIVTVPLLDGKVDFDKLKSMIDKETAGVIVQQPNFFGLLENVEEIESAVHTNKAAFIMVADPISLAVLKTPAECKADIVVGEAQSLGNSLSFGGPYLGYMACSKKYMRKMPGRIVGETVDSDGKRSFVLTLQAREQHIRREQAQSNICSNQALCALAASIYLSMVGKQGLKDIALRSYQLAHYAAEELEKAGLKLKYQGPFFREFAVEVKDPAAMNKTLLDNGIIGGYELQDAMLLAFTEKRSKAEIDKLVAVLGGNK